MFWVIFILNLICSLAILFAFSFAVSFVVGNLINLCIEYKDFNGGVCPKCGKPLVKMDVDFKGEGRGYSCPGCIHVAFVSFHWIDKKYNKY